jgi:hypothetical protein
MTTTMVGKREADDRVDHAKNELDVKRVKTE